MARNTIQRQFSSVDALRDVAAELPEARKEGDVLVNHDDGDEWDKIHPRSGVVVDGYGAVGVVSESDRYYNVIQFSEPLEALANDLERREAVSGVSGDVTVSKDGSKMSAFLAFEGDDVDVEVAEGDVIRRGIRVSTAHTGHQGVKYQIGAVRQVCSNGMVAFAKDLTFQQSHQDRFKASLAQTAVDGILERTAELEDRLRRARQTRFKNRDEAILVLMDAGIDGYLWTDDPVETLREALDREIDHEGEPTLWDAYNAATHALTHMTPDKQPGHVTDTGLATAGNLLDQYGNGVPEAEELSVAAIENRTDALTSDDGEELWEGEREAVRELSQARAV